MRFVTNFLPIVRLRKGAGGGGGGGGGGRMAERRGRTCILGRLRGGYLLIDSC